MGPDINMLESVFVSIAGMSVVFGILITISIMIYFLRFLNNNKQKASIEENIHENEADFIENEEDEIVAVISAVVSHVLKGKQYIIKNIRDIQGEPIEDKFKELNMWSKYGRMNIMTSHSNFGKGRLEKWKS